MFRTTRSGTVYLIVRAKQNPKHWVFPKGHIEAGETLQEAGLREVREEAGTDAEIVSPLRTRSFESSKGPIRVAYFLMRYRGEVEPAELRDRVWCSYDEARERLSSHDAREILRLAHQQQG